MGPQQFSPSSPWSMRGAVRGSTLAICAQVILVYGRGHGWFSIAMRSLPVSLVMLGEFGIVHVLTELLTMTNGAFLKWWYPQVIHFRLGFSITNHPATGVPPWLWKPPNGLKWQSSDHQWQLVWGDAWRRQFDDQRHHCCQSSWEPNRPWVMEMWWE